MSALAIPRAGLGSAVALAVTLSAAVAFAEEAPRLPRPRPMVEQAPAVDAAPPLPRPRPEGEAPDLQDWAEDVGSRFRAAEAELEPVAPVVEQTVVTEAAEAFQAIEQVARLPRARPERSGHVLAMVAPSAPVEVAPPVMQPEDTACLARLQALGVRYTKEEPIEPFGRCSVQYPLNVTSLGSGVAIAPEATLNCRTTEQLALWTRDVLVPEARETLGATPTKVVHASTYVCRTRNNEPGAKLSEHAHANAVDIRTIAFAEREPLDIVDRDTSLPDGAFQASIRAGSCAHFTTVLGPRTNAAHAMHFHFDMAERRGGYRLCDLGETSIAGGEEP
jgi:hypothetical protein